MTLHSCPFLDCGEPRSVSRECAGTRHLCNQACESLSHWYISLYRYLNMKLRILPSKTRTLYIFTVNLDFVCEQFWLMAWGCSIHPGTWQLSSVQPQCLRVSGRPSGSQVHGLLENRPFSAIQVSSWPWLRGYLYKSRFLVQHTVWSVWITSHIIL